VERDEQFYGTAKAGIIPVVIDDDGAIMKDPKSYLGMPKRFREVQMYHCPLGVPSTELVESLKESARTGLTSGERRP
jgi:hypothetical protein